MLTSRVGEQTPENVPLWLDKDCCHTLNLFVKDPSETSLSCFSAVFTERYWLIKRVKAVVFTSDSLKKKEKDWFTFQRLNLRVHFPRSSWLWPGDGCESRVTFESSCLSLCSSAFPVKEPGPECTTLFWFWISSRSTNASRQIKGEKKTRENAGFFCSSRVKPREGNNEVFLSDPEF